MYERVEFYLLCAFLAEQRPGAPTGLLEAAAGYAMQNPDGMNMRRWWAAKILDMKIERQNNRPFDQSTVIGASDYYGLMGRDRTLLRRVF